MGEYKYLKSHEWVCEECGKIGISDYAQHELGDIVFIELPEVGEEVEAGKPFANIESVKAVFEIFSPVTGKIVDVNSDLTDHPELINEDAMNAWMIKVEISGKSEELMDETAYQEMIQKSQKK